MQKESKQIKVISIAITIIALIAIIARIMKPTMMIDSITLWLIAIAIVPWLAPLIKSIEWGGAKVEFQERLDQLETDTTKIHADMENMAHSLNDMMQNKPAIANTDSHLSAFVHIATAHNTQSNYTIIDNPLTNNNPSGILMVTQNWSPPTSKGGVYNSQPIGVWYTHEGKWSIFNQDKHVSMPIGAAFNVQVLSQR